MTEKVDELITSIKNSGDYQNLMKIKQQIENDKVITSLSEGIIKLQKQTVKTGVDCNQEIDDLYYQLNNIDLYIEYLNARDKYNALINHINQTINNYINDLTIL